MNKILAGLFLLISISLFSQTDGSFTNGSVSEDADSTCVFTGTRNEVRAEALGSRLELGCQYVITNWSRGCLTGVEAIILTPTTINSFSAEVDVKTSYYAVAWHGEYDINTNRITKLEDNSGNTVEGRLGTEVDRFPWGSNWQENTIITADLLCDCAPTITLRNNKFTTDSYTDIRGATGTMINSSFSTDADSRWRNATALNINRLSATTGHRIRGDGSTGTIFTRWTASDYGYDGHQNMTDAVRQFGGILGGWVYFTGGIGQTLYQTHVLSRGTVRTFSGDHRLYQCNVASYGEVRNEAGAGRWYNYYCDITSRGYKRNYNTNYVREYATSASARGEWNFRDAAAQTHYFSSSTNYAIVTISGTATRVYGSDFRNLARFNASGGNHYYNDMSRRTINTAFNTRSLTGYGSGTHTLTAPNTNRGVDYFNNSLL